TISCGNKEEKKIEEIVKEGIYTKKDIVELRKYVSLEEIEKMSKIRKKEREQLEKELKEAKEILENTKLGESFVGSVNGNR
ncbi:hypothetical protein, partial [Streptobacillus moniliformis]